MPRETWWNLPDGKRRRITVAAMAEFGARGFSAGSLNVIAREAGIAKGSLFQYFDDKLDMFAAISEAGSNEIQAAVLEGVDLERAPYFDCVRAFAVNFLRFFRASPIHRATAHAAANEPDAEARAALGGVTNQHYVDVLRPLAERARARGELRDGVDIEQLIAMTVLLLRHLNSAPFYQHLDPVLGLFERSPKQVDRIAAELVDVLERAFAA
jgi:AcrR family transcriptional regulator